MFWWMEAESTELVWPHLSKHCCPLTSWSQRQEWINFHLKCQDPTDFTPVAIQRWIWSFYERKDVIHLFIICVYTFISMNGDWIASCAGTCWCSIFISATSLWSSSCSLLSSSQACFTWLCSLTSWMLSCLSASSSSFSWVCSFTRRLCSVLWR